jgi:hypothetical protein
MNSTPKIEIDTDNIETESYRKTVEITSGPHLEGSSFLQLSGEERDTLMYRLYTF